MKKWIAMGIFAVMVIGMVLMSGCTNTGSTSTPTPQIVYVTVLVTPTIPKEVVVSNGDYTAHGLRFQVNLDEKGNKISYKDNSGNPQYLISQTGKQLLNFEITMTSIDGDESFYVSDFFLMDDNGISYDAQCPIDAYKNCKNQDGLSSMVSPISGQKTIGKMIFSIPENIDHVFLIYKFSDYSGNPQVVKFDQVLRS